MVNFEANAAIAVYYRLRAYTFQLALNSETIVSTAAAVKFWHAVGGLYMLVYYLHHQPSPLTKFNTVLTAGSTLRLLTTSGVSFEGAALTGGRYGSVIAP